METGAILVSETVLLEAIEDEVKNHFEWASIAGVIEMEAYYLALNILIRLRQLHQDTDEGEAS